MRDMGADYRGIYYQQRLTPLEFLYDEKHLRRLYEADAVNTQFIQSIMCEEYEKQMYEVLLQKCVINGSVVPLIEKSKHDSIREQANKYVKMFYYGDPLTPYEVDVERMYLSDKLNKHQTYQKRKSLRFKVRWTVQDLNRYQDQVNYRMNEPEYFGTPKAKFAPLDLDQALENMYIHMDIQKTSTLRRAMTWFTDTRAFERGQKRSVLQATTMLTRALMYIDSWEFVNCLDVENDFHINHSIANMHVWLIYQRLRDFSENKFAFQLREELIESFNKLTRTEMQDVDVLRKQKKIDDIENYLFAIRRNFDFHFFINAKSVDDPYYKMDALVWSCIFHEKVPRYAPKVYKMAEYFMQHYNYLKTLSFTDIEQCMVDWCAYRVPFNYQNKLIKLNPPLSEEEFEKEYNSPYKTKKYHFNFRSEDELTEENLRKTFVNLCTSAFFHNKEKTIRQENFNLDSMNSKEKEDVIYKMKRQLELMSELPITKESFFSSVSTSPLQTQFNIWKRNLFVPLHDQLQEQAKRKIQELQEEAQLEEEKKSIWFEAKRDLHDLDAEEKRLEKHQEILRQHLDEQKKTQVEGEESKEGEKISNIKDSLGGKKKKQWRLW